jgi:hypothetical protein
MLRSCRLNYNSVNKLHTIAIQGIVRSLHCKGKRVRALTIALHNTFLPHVVLTDPVFSRVVVDVLLWHDCERKLVYSRLTVPRVLKFVLSSHTRPSVGQLYSEGSVCVKVRLNNATAVFQLNFLVRPLNLEHRNFII